MLQLEITSRIVLQLALMDATLQAEAPIAFEKPHVNDSMLSSLTEYFYKLEFLCSPGVTITENVLNDTTCLTFIPLYALLPSVVFLHFQGEVRSRGCKENSFRSF